MRKLIAVLVVCLAACAGPKTGQLVKHHDSAVDREILAQRFAPRLFLHPREPYTLVEVVPVFHPDRPFIAYHLFFEDDAFYTWQGSKMDHEIVWIGYDPVTYKVTDVLTLWHRAILTTDTCVLAANAAGQQAPVLIQWGQHGVLPLGWKALQTARPHVDLVVDYNLVKARGKEKEFGSGDTLKKLPGSYKEYAVFTVEADAGELIKPGSILVSEYPNKQLETRLGKKISVKKEWPFWTYFSR